MDAAAAEVPRPTSPPIRTRTRARNPARAAIRPGLPWQVTGCTLFVTEMGFR